MFSIKSFIQGFKDEMQTIISDHSILLTVIAAPVVYAFLMGSIYLKKEVKQIPFAVVDYDQTPTTRHLTRLLAADPTIRLEDRLPGYQQGVDEMNRLKIQGFVLFPKGFEKGLLKGKGGDVKLYLNTTRFLPSNDLNRAVNTVFLTVDAGIRLHQYATQGLNNKIAMPHVNPVMADVHPLYNATNNYGDFLLPALLFFILQQTLLIGMAESFSGGREKGTLQKVLHNDEIDIAAWLSGRMSYYLLLYTSYIWFFMEVIFPVYGLPLRGNRVALAAITLLFLLVVMVYAMIVASFSKKQVRIMQVLAFTSYPLFLLSGYSWPIASMPAPLQWLAAMIPTTPMMDAVAKLCAEGTGWLPVLGDFRQLLILLLVSTLLLYWRIIVLKKKTAPAGEVAL
jgi:ABC-2 type transport system permease protein